MLSRFAFQVLWRNNLVYNQCWEDPAVDRQALELDPNDRVMAITSGGCNALDYALLGAKIVAVDANPRQNHLLELKLAAIRALDFEAFFTLFGEGGSKRTREIYEALRHELPDEARVFWDREVRLFEPRRLRGRSFYYCGTAGLVALAIKWYIDRVGSLRGVVNRILDADSLGGQVDLYHRELRSQFLGERLLNVVGSPGVLSLLGVPGPQREMVASAPGGFPGFLRQCLDHVMSVALLRENYFWSVYVTGRYSRESCPQYLKPANFARLKAGLVHNVRTATATVTDFLRKEPEPFSAFVLLDHMDWLAGQPALLEEEWAEIGRCARPGARVIFRSGGKDARFLPVSVLRRVVFETARAKRLHRQDRVGTYGSFHIARLAPA